MGVRFAERRGARSTQVDQVRADAERIADVRAQCANVGAGFAPHPEEDVPAIDLERLERVDVPGSLLPLARRPNRRSLIDLPDDPAHQGADTPLVDVLVELHHADVFLVPFEDRLERPGRVGEGDREDAGHARIEGAGVARFRDAEHVPHPRADLVEVGPVGLSTIATPSRIRSSIDRSSGLVPYFESGTSWRTTRSLIPPPARRSSR